MLGRRLLYEFMIMGPVIMLLGLAVQARTSQPAFEPYGYSPRAQQEILAYRPLVFQIRSLHNLPQPERHAQARKLARQWLAAFDSGALERLPMQNILDSSRDGIKGQIGEAAQVLTAELCAAARLQKNTNQGMALQDVLLGLQILDCVKFFDVYSIGHVSLRQRSLLELAEFGLGPLSPERKAELAEAVARLDIDDAKLEAAIEDADRLYVIDGERWGEPRLKILEPLSRIDPWNRRRGTVHRSFRVASLDHRIASQVSSISFARSSFEREKQMLAEMIARLRSGDSPAY